MGDILGGGGKISNVSGCLKFLIYKYIFFFLGGGGGGERLMQGPSLRMKKKLEYPPPPRDPPLNRSFYRQPNLQFRCDIFFAIN